MNRLCTCRHYLLNRLQRTQVASSPIRHDAKHPNFLSQYNNWVTLTWLYWATCLGFHPSGISFIYKLTCRHWAICWWVILKRRRVGDHDLGRLKTIYHELDFQNFHPSIRNMKSWSWYVGCRVSFRPQGGGAGSFFGARGFELFPSRAPCFTLPVRVLSCVRARTVGPNISSRIFARQKLTKKLNPCVCC